MRLYPSIYIGVGMKTLPHVLPLHPRVNTSVLHEYLRTGNRLPPEQLSTCPQRQTVPFPVASGRMHWRPSNTSRTFPTSCPKAADNKQTDPGGPQTGETL